MLKLDVLRQMIKRIRVKIILVILLMSHLCVAQQQSDISHSSVVSLNEKLSSSGAKTLKNIGVDTVFRYYTFAEQRYLPTQKITKEELNVILEAGLGVAVVYEYESRIYSPLIKNGKVIKTKKRRVRERYTAKMGRRDVLSALEQAKVIGQPKGSAIYFGVDSSGLPSKFIVDYFAVISKKCRQAGFKVGVYGPGDNCRELKQAGLVDFTWLAKSPDWDGSKEYENSLKWDLYQNIRGFPVYMDDKFPKQLGVDSTRVQAQVGFNVLNNNVRSIGQWYTDPDKVVFGADVSTQFDKYKYATLNHFRIFSKPDRASEVVFSQGPTISRSVKILEETNEDWVKVYLGDEFPTYKPLDTKIRQRWESGEGYVPREWLVTYGQMPHHTELKKLRFGDMDSDVIALQEQLNKWAKAKGLSAILVDGEFGAHTDKLLKQFQKEVLKGISIENLGVTTHITWIALYR